MGVGEGLLLSSAPCGTCEHAMRHHDHLYDEQTPLWGKVGRYRCNKCGCGSQYKVRVYELKPGETPEQFMERMTAE